ncbi:hypothetical protein OKW21_004282 [Catalinimonas alkaloidigena]|nr:hypothetical protein [Catalinimonas alkaloidigena]MDF9799019.1 hypothetical protein [Catalinimonas alkaloidigena]
MSILLSHSFLCSVPNYKPAAKPGRFTLALATFSFSDLPLTVG